MFSLYVFGLYLDFKLGHLMGVRIMSLPVKNNRITELTSAQKDFDHNYLKLLRLGLSKGVSLGLGTIASIASFATLAALPINHARAQAPVPTESPTDAGSPTPTDNPSDVEVSTVERFSCQVQNGQHVVMYQPKSQPDQYFPWAQPSAMGGGWSPERRCFEISRRLEFYRPDGLVELRTSTENGYNILCATTENRGDCRIVLTVPQGADPTLVRDRVFGNLATADRGETTTAVPTFVEGDRNVLNSQVPELLGLPNVSTIPELGNLPNNIPNLPGTISTPGYSGTGIYLKPFLDPADGGTGARLVNGVSRRGARLSPNNFR
ncbi:hypothetical protein Pse7367_0812 [Thalassoporum mexicanum PCC 7367]|nr:hypothetical protein Pse7367_0812 [Pseudanabaena sp. PCC 7367]